MNEKRTTTSRRSLLKLAGSAAGLALVGGSATAAEQGKGPPRSKKTPLGFANEDFYDADGKFSVEKGKEAVIAVCEYHGYPMFDGFREDLWVSDYGTGEFTKLGLAAYLFVNNEEDRYMLLDITCRYL